MYPRHSSYRRSKIAFLIFLILIGYSIYSYQQMDLIRAGIKNLEQSVGGVIDETGRKLAVVDQLNVFGSDLNEIRRFLYLPTKNYNIVSVPTTEEDDQESGSGRQITPLLFQYVEKLGAEQQKKEDMVLMRQQFGDVFRKEPIVIKMEEKSLTLDPLVESDQEMTILGKIKTVPFVTFGVNKDTKRYFITDFQGKKEVDTLSTLETSLLAYMDTLDSLVTLKSVVDSAQKDMELIIKSSEARNIFAAKKLTYAFPNISNKENQTLVSLVIQPSPLQYGIQTSTGSQLYEDITAFKQALLENLGNLDARTSIEKMVENKKKEIIDSITDPAFQDILRQKNLVITPVPLEETDRIYFYVTDHNNNRVGALIIEKGTGEVKIVDEKGLNAKSLEEFLTTPDVKKKS